ncbi:MAG: hypothetical protein ACOCWZ_10375, partial [Spirochaetota bacterium]
MILYFILFASTLSMLFALMHLLVRKRRVENTNLSALLFCISLVLFQGWCMLTGTMYTMPCVLGFHLTLVYLVGPFAFFAYHLVVLPPETLPEHRSMYFYPVLPAFVVDGIYVLLPETRKIEILKAFLADGGGWSLPGVRLLFVVAGIFVAYYLLNLLRIFARSRGSHSSGKLLLINSMFVLCTLLAAESAIIGYVLPSKLLIMYGMLGIGMLFVG